MPALMTLALATASGARAETVYLLSRDAELYTLDPVSLAVQSQVAITGLPGLSTANGLAYHPGTGQLLVVLRTSNAVPSVLAELDPVTGVATTIGNIGLGISGIAVASDGRLLAVSGDGGSPAETLFQVDLDTGAPTQLAALGNGDDGEAISAGPEPGVLYHFSGLSSQVFERVDTTTFTTTTIATNFASLSEGTGMAWSAARDAFLIGDLSDDLHQLTRDGVDTLLVPNIATNPKGIAIVGQPHFLLRGNCPGTVNIFFSGMTPGGNFGVVAADGFGAFPLPGGPCAGEPTVLAGGSFSFVNLLTANPNGNLILQRVLPNNAWCGTWLQAVDLQTCLMSNAGEVP